MFYCLNCKTTHEQMYTEKIFSTGYVLVGDRKIPLGFCLLHPSTIIERNSEIDELENSLVEC